MNIYIDESGWFSTHSDSASIDKAWCTVGAVVVPHQSEKKVKSALIDLKKSLNLKPDEEIERRPDPESACFVEFIDKLKGANCIVHAMTTNRSVLNDEKTRQHKRDQIKARERYVALTGDTFSSEDVLLMRKELEEISSLIEQSSAQEYNQIILQSALISFMLDKTITHYGRTDPRELSRFTWIYDRKTDKKKKGIATFESLFSKMMPPSVQVNFISEPRGLPDIGNGYDYFFKNYGSKSKFSGMSSEELSERKRLYGADYAAISNSMVPFDFQKLLNNNSGFYDSDKTPGLQVADLVVSGINRLLRGNVDNNAKVAETLGGLLINSPRLDLPSVPQLNFYESTVTKPEFSYENLELLNNSAKELYTLNFRRGFTKTFNDFVTKKIKPQKL
jgi:hypothetical protein